jgi:predicted NBD/HSP70 family sugar kinase
LGKAARRVVEALRAAGPSTRAALVGTTGLSRPTVSGVVAELVDRGLVETGADEVVLDRGTGRPAELLKLHRSAGIAVGVEVGRRHVHVLVADLGRQPLGKGSCLLDEGVNPDEALDHAAGLVRKTLHDGGIRLDEVVGVGLGIPAPITREGKIGSRTLLRAWADVVPRTEFSNRLDGTPVFVDNDASLGALGEYVFGAGRGSRDMTYVKVATGIGAGTVRDGRLHRGAAGTAGELGHITLDLNGAWCACGNRGCVELYAGGKALLDQVRGRRPDLTDVGDLVRGVDEGDLQCNRLVEEAGEHLGVALGALVNLEGPDRIVIGGELGGIGVFIDAAKRKLAQVALAPAVEAVEVVRAELDDHVSAWGGVALVLKAAAPDVRGTAST